MFKSILAYISRVFLYIKINSTCSYKAKDKRDKGQIIAPIYISTFMIIGRILFLRHLVSKQTFLKCYVSI
jgi:hypothetical protein